MGPDSVMNTAGTAITFGSKLTDLVRDFVKPFNSRRLTKANIKSLEAYALFQAEHPDIEFSCNENGLQVMVPGYKKGDANSLEEASRLSTVEVKKLLGSTIEASSDEVKASNIGATIDEAAKIIPSEQSVSNKPVDADWMLHFFDHAGYASDDDVRAIWARILAGEVANPESCSVRTMETLSQISRDEANLFERVSKLVIWISGRYFISYDHSHSTITFDEADLLQEAGLLSVSDSVTLTHTPSKDGVINFFMPGLLIHVEMLKHSQLVQNVRILSTAGKQLYSVLDVAGDVANAKAFAQVLATKKNVGTIRIHRLQNLDIASGTYGYETEPIFEEVVNQESDES
jgi:hypothetical protein